MKEEKLIKAAKKLKKYCDSQARCDDCIFKRLTRNDRCEIECMPALWKIPRGKR